MPGSVLIIDADEEFAGRLKSTLETHGAAVQTTGDGRAGLDMARAEIPSAIVVCVELPRMSGYSICAKLKKDPNLKTVTLVITSAEATQETFEHHKKLKNRAEEYLRKPFEPQTLVDTLRPYMTLETASMNFDGTTADASAAASENVVKASEPPSPDALDQIDAIDQTAFTEEEDFHFDEVPDFPIEASVAVETAVPDGPKTVSAFASGSGLVESYEEDEVMTTVGVVPSAGNEVLFREIEQLRTELEAEREAHAQTVRDRDEALANERAAVGQLQTLSEGAPSQITATRDLLAIKKELHERDKQLLELRDAAQRKERELLDQRDREMDFESQIVQLQEDLEHRGQEKADLEKELGKAETRITEHQSQLEAAETAAEAAQAELQSQIEGLQRDIEDRDLTIATHEEEIGELRSSNQTLSDEMTKLNNEVSAVLAESTTLREQLQAAQTQANQLDSELQEAREEGENTRSALEATQASLLETEEQAGRAFERIRRDGETKTKVRQALDIALRLLTEPDEAENGVEVEETSVAEELRP